MAIFYGFLDTGLVVILACLAAATARQLARSVKLSELLSKTKGGKADPERVMLLFVTVVGALAYLSYGLHEGLAQGKLPDIPEEFLAAMGSGNILYLSGKIFR
jgi:hypothetical protein